MAFNPGSKRKEQEERKFKDRIIFITNHTPFILLFAGMAGIATALRYIIDANGDGADLALGITFVGAGLYGVVAGTYSFWNHEDRNSTSSSILGLGIILAAVLSFLTFSGGGGSGTITDCTNLGAGEGITTGASGADCQFKSLTAGSNITLTSSATEIQIASSGGGAFPYVIGRSESATELPYVKPGIPLYDSDVEILLTETLYVEPFFVSTQIGIDQMMLEVVSNNLAGFTCRLGIYEIDDDWQLTDLVIDAGTVSTETTGVKTLSFTEETLAPGKYATAHICNSAVGLRFWAGELQSGVRPTGTDTSLVAKMYVSSVAGQHAALSNPGIDWTTLAWSTNGFDHNIVIRVSTP